MVQLHFLDDDDDGDATLASPLRRGTRCRPRNRSCRSWRNSIAGSCVGIHVFSLSFPFPLGHMTSAPWSRTPLSSPHYLSVLPSLPSAPTSLFARASEPSSLFSSSLASLPFFSFSFLIALFYSAVTIRKSISVNPRQPRQRRETVGVGLRETETGTGMAPSSPCPPPSLILFHPRPKSNSSFRRWENTASALSATPASRKSTAGQESPRAAKICLCCGELEDAVAKTRHQHHLQSLS